MDQANILIVGGGVIGCSIARAVSQRWQDVFLLEQNPRVGMATSTRNSGVIHSGIYYPKDSLKAKKIRQPARPKQAAKKDVVDPAAPQPNSHIPQSHHNPPEDKHEHHPDSVEQQYNRS